jgi:4'-phosphopantetheinyl transferase EntD
MSTKSSALQLAIDAIAIPRVLIDHRVIACGDESALLPEELDAFAASVIKVQRASGAARIVARDLLSELGQTRQAIKKSASGAPIWPNGVVGSMAHDAEIAIAAVAKRCDYVSLGIDVEPAEAIEPDLLELIATANERAQCEIDPRYGRLLFAVKEAVYKTVFPVDGVFLDHHDVEVSLQGGTARVLDSRIIRFRYCVSTHVVALAYIPEPRPA